MNINTETDKIKKGGVALRMTAYLLTVMFVFSAVSILCGTDTTDVYHLENGAVDLTGIDFDRETVRITSDALHIYDLAFYTPEDFVSGKMTREPVRLFGTGPSLKDYGTLRILLKLPAGNVYAISAKNTSYAQRMFINGKEYPPIGVTGDNAGAVTPKTARYAAAFAPEGDSTEIILHYSNFVHSDTGGFYPITLGSAQNIMRAEQSRTLRAAVVAAALLTAMLFFFGMFLFFGKRRYFLWFSLACGCIALRGLLIDDKVIMLLLPNLDWYLAIRLEYLATCGAALFSVLYFSALFPGAAIKWALHGYAVFCALNATFICLAPPLVFTRFVTATVWIYALFSVYLLTAILVSVLYKKRTAVLSASEQVLLLAGFLLYLLLSMMGIYTHMYYTKPLWELDYPETGMTAFLFINILALALGFARTEQELGNARRELDEARRSERETEETNRMLARLNRVKSDFLDNISHEMRTPLTVMGGYAGVTIKQLKMNAVNDKTYEILDFIQREAISLGRLVEQLKEVSLEKERQFTLTDTDAEALLKRAADACAPLCRENKNKIIIQTGAERMPLRVDADGIYRALVNLISNAARHTKGGSITLKSELSEDVVIITVTDNGEGIPGELLPDVFERGVSGGGSSGLGLAICKGIAEEHGGTIELQSERGKGTTVRFTLPVTKGDEQV